MGVAGALEGGMEIGAVGLIGKHRGEIGAAAEPGLAGDDVARVHVHRRHQGRAHVGDQGDAAGPEAAVVFGAGNLLGEVGRELAVDGGDVDADLFEDPAAHDRHDTAAAARAFPGLAPEAANWHIGEALGVLAL